MDAPSSDPMPAGNNFERAGSATSWAGSVGSPGSSPRSRGGVGAMGDLLHERSFFDIPRLRLDSGAADGGGPGNAEGHFELADATSLMHLRGEKKKLCMVLCGLPARGKTYTAKKLVRYLSWMGYLARVFNIGQYRRSLCGASVGVDFFDPDNQEFVELRDKCARAALNDVFAFFAEGGQVALYDGTNSTKARRAFILDHINQRNALGDINVEVVWIEIQCDNASLIEKTIVHHKLKGPDFREHEEAQARKEFHQRIAMYEKGYQTLDDSNELWSYVKLIDAGRMVIANRIHGYLPSRIVSFLLNLNIYKSPIYLSRHGQSEFNMDERVGGDSSITANGRAYAKKLSLWIQQQKEVQRSGLAVWCSTLRRTIETTSYIPKVQPVEWRALCEIDAGICDGMTYEEIKRSMPQEFEKRKQDKLAYRYPQGESYLDVIQRLESVIIELERAKGPVLVVAHRAVLRCLYSYFVESPQEEIPYVDMDLHTVLKISATPAGMEVEKFFLGGEGENPLRLDVEGAMAASKPKP